jgi:hypothetical protein
MERDGLVMFQPTRYLVPDEHARQKSVEDGISSNLIKTCGQPAFANLEDLYKKASQHDNPFDSLIVNGFKVILFASEPVAQDHGSSLNENSNYRGYTEKEAILILINSIKVMDELIFVVVLPHPRQDVIELNKLWRACGGELYGKVQDGRLNKCDFFPFIYGVVGMASTLLYEAWLVGIPVLSIQPGLLNDSYRKLEEKEGIIFIDQYVGAEEKVVKWLTGLTDFSVQQSQAELELHKQASKRISEEVLSFHE